MNSELRERRLKTWKLYIVRGVSHSRVCQRIAAEYDMSEGGVKADIARMDDWLPKLDAADLDEGNGLSRIREARENRQRMQQMALKARQNDNLELELKIREKIGKEIDRDISSSQSLGMTPKEPDQTEHSTDGALMIVDRDDSDDTDDEST